MSEGTEYTLVDISNLEATNFLVRAPLKQILLWQKIYAQEGKPAKRLDLLSTDLQSLQYLLWNATQQQPGDDLETLVAQCAEAATKLAVDATSEEELNSRLSQTASTPESEATMAQGSTVAGPLEKGAAPAGKKAGKSDEGKAADKAAKEKAKAEAKAKREQEKADAKAERERLKAEKATKSPTPGPDQATTDAAFDAVADRASAEAIVQAAYLAQTPRKNGSRGSDPQSYAVRLNLSPAEGQPATETPVSAMWFAATVSGLKTAQFYRRDALKLAQRLGLKVYQDGQEIVPKEPKAPKEEAPATAEAPATV